MRRGRSMPTPQPAEGITFAPHRREHTRLSGRAPPPAPSTRSRRAGGYTLDGAAGAAGRGSSRHRGRARHGARSEPARARRRDGRGCAGAPGSAGAGQASHADRRVPRGTAPRRGDVPRHVSHPRRTSRPSGGDARAVAHDVLVRVETEDAFADVLLAHRLAGDALAARDRALATELVYGTLVWQGRLDHFLRRLLHEPLEHLDPPVRTALRLGLYQLRVLERVPAYAAVDGSVRLAGKRAGGLVNAVLRRATREDEPPLPDDPVDRLAIEWSLVERVSRSSAPTRPRPSWRRTRAAAQRSARTRVEPRRTCSGRRSRGRGRDAAERGGRRRARRRGARRALRDLPAWRDGLFAFQGEGIALVARLVDWRRGRACWTCAAPGGKTLAIAERLDGHPIARSTQSRRPPPASYRRRTAGRRGRRRQHAARRPCARSTPSCSTRPAQGSGRSAPSRSSGAGGRGRRAPGDAPARSRRGVAPLVKPGGLLVYVCTHAGRDDRRGRRELLAAHPRFVVEPPTGHASIPTASSGRRRIATLWTASSRPGCGRGVTRADLDSHPPFDRDRHMPLVAPSILASDFSRLADEVSRDGRRRRLDPRRRDGRTSSRRSRSARSSWARSAATPLPLDVHLMIEHPERQIAEFVKAGADRLTVHVETCPDVPAVLTIRDAGATPASLNPPTPLEHIRPLRPSDRSALVAA